LGKTYSLGLVAAAVALAQGPEDRLVRDILRELIETDTTHSTGSTGKAAEKMAARLRAAGFAPSDIVIAGPRPERANLVARIRGTGQRKPILFIAHLDVVEAKKADWTTDPFQFVEKDGYYYGRGTTDCKGPLADLVASFIRLQRERYRPDGDHIMALTADEEGGDENGIAWLLKNRRTLIDAEYCINPDGGGVEMKNGKRLLNEIQYSEKAYQSFIVEARNKGGHSSIPRKDNAVYQLSKALVRLSDFEFPVMLDDGRRAYFESVAARERQEVKEAINRMLSTNPPDGSAVAFLSQSPDWNAMLRTTCVATMLEAGHAENALPQLARATVNCRILPRHDPNEVERKLNQVLHDSELSLKAVTPISEAASDPSPLNPAVMQAAKSVTESMWPGLPTVPTMSTGATDGKHLRGAGVPTYGISGITGDNDDIRAHGKDERVPATALFEGREFMYRLIRLLSGGR
jgi:acetylornithine deacetylase/succinyl-diaminopimelate desuccinylase-like protein